MLGRRTEKHEEARHRHKIIDTWKENISTGLADQARSSILINNTSLTNLPPLTLLEKIIETVLAPGGKTKVLIMYKHYMY